MTKTQVKRPSEVDPLELNLHWDLYECPHCDGGEAQVTYPDSDQVDWETCDQCGGEGNLAVRRSAPGIQGEDIEYIKLSVPLPEEQCKTLLQHSGLPTDGAIVEVSEHSTLITFSSNQDEGDRHE